MIPDSVFPDSHVIPREVKALVFDCDGTLVDTMPIHWRAWCKICKETGLVFDKTDFYRLAGIPGKKIINVLAKQQGIKLDPYAIYDRKREYFLEGLTTVSAIQCVVRFAQEAHRLEIPIAVASGSSRAQVQNGKANIAFTISSLANTKKIGSLYTLHRITPLLTWLKLSFINVSFFTSATSVIFFNKFVPIYS